MTIRRLYFIFAIYFLALFLFIIMPATFTAINKIEPLFLGFPRLQYSILMYVLLNTFGLIALYALENKVTSQKRKAAVKGRNQ